MSSEKKARQQKAKAAMREQAALEWEEHMVLEPAQLKDLLDYLDESLGTAHCDHSLRMTREWAKQHGIDADGLEESVVHFGGGCDCEVLANVDPQTQVDGWPLYLERYGSG